MTWPRVPLAPYRSEIISELNRQLDPELWERFQTQKVTGLYIKSVKTTVETFERESGIGIVLDYQPGRDSPSPSQRTSRLAMATCGRTRVVKESV